MAIIMKGAPFNQAIADEVCCLIAEGKSGRMACKIVGIHPIALYDWIAENEDFANRYNHAKECCGEYYADYAVEVTQEVPALIVDGGGSARIDPSWVMLVKIKADVSKWAAGVMKPRKYAPKAEPVDVNVNHTLAGRLNAAMINVTPKLMTVSSPSEYISLDKNGEITYDD